MPNQQLGLYNFLLFLIEQEQLGKILSKWMIRRTKLLIADQLPKKGLC